ncbi:hypothetical protein [Thiocystis violacea]|uniref:hypothetical protein n=1 Tax=Thiocystis violacea TaxID=13725 RepID=UPI001902F954|nr:hypothetical protein [Thiocystis violacea]
MAQSTPRIGLFLVTKLQLRDLSDEALLHDVGGFRPLIGSIQTLILEFATRSFVTSLNAGVHRAALAQPEFFRRQLAER